MKKLIILTLLTTLMLVHSASAATGGEPLVQATLFVYPATIAPGNDGYIQLTLKNSGTATANRISISSTTTDAPIKYSWTAELGSLNAGDSTTMIFKFSVLDTASPGLYSINFNIDYCQDYICKTIYPTAIINVQSPSALELISIKPSSLRPGERTNVTFTIANKGGSVNNVIFTWTSTGNTILPLGSDNRVVVPTISANSYYDIPAEVSVSPSATPGVYPLSIFIQYLDKSGVNQTITSIAGVEISGQTDFDVTMQDSTATSITLAVTNIGSTTAYSTIVSIPPQDNFMITGPSATVVGNLNAGDYALATFQITSIGNITRVPVGGNRTLTRNISIGRNIVVEISYTDMLGTRRAIQKEVRLAEVGTGEGTTRTRTVQGSPLQILSGNGFTYVVIGIVGIIAIIVFLKFYKRKKK